jgi:phospholipase C
MSVMRKNWWSEFEVRFLFGSKWRLSSRPSARHYRRAIRARRSRPGTPYRDISKTSTTLRKAAENEASSAAYGLPRYQPLDFFGDGPRIPLLVISPFSTGGRVSHTYTDQVSVLKFIERNWRLGKISNRSRDNLPNPIMHDRNPWVPVNMPAIGDLFDMFDFDHGHGDHDDQGQNGG